MPDDLDADGGLEDDESSFEEYKGRRRGADLSDRRARRDRLQVARELDARYKDLSERMEKCIVDFSKVPEGWIVYELGQSPLHHLWFCVLVHAAGHHEFCGDGPVISAGGEEFDTAQTALNYAIQQAIEFDEKHDDQTSDQGREEGPADAAGQRAS